MRATLKLENAEIIRIDRAGTIVTPLPNGLSEQDIDVAAVQSGQTTSGRTGNVVFAVAPVNLTQAERVRLRLGGTLAILLTRDVSGLGRVGPISSLPAAPRCSSRCWWRGR